MGRLKRAGRVQQDSSSDNRGSSSTIGQSCVGLVAAVVSKSKGIKLGAIKLRKPELAALRNDLQSELPQLRRVFPRGFLFALPEGDVPVCRTQERSWTVEDVAAIADAGRVTIVLMEDTAPLSRGAVMYERVCSALAAHTLAAGAAKTRLSHAWRRHIKAAPVGKLLASCGPALLASGAAAAKALRREGASGGDAPAVTPRPLARTTSSTRAHECDHRA